MVAADGVGEFPVVGESRAGHLDQLPVAPGSVAYITTGRCRARCGEMDPEVDGAGRRRKAAAIHGHDVYLRM